MIDPVQARKQVLKSCRRVVLKVGTRLLADRTAIARLVTQIHALRESGHPCKIMVGGAVLTPEYAAEIGADYYAADAKQSADIAKLVLG